MLLTRPPLERRLSEKNPLLVRLACVTHAASVCPEPGSNSPCKEVSHQLTSRLPGWESLPYLYELFHSLCTQICSGPLVTLSVTCFYAPFTRDRTVTRCIRCATASHSSVVQVHRRPYRHLHPCSRIGHKVDIIIPCSPRQASPVLERVSYISLPGKVFLRFLASQTGPGILRRTQILHRLA